MEGVNVGDKISRFTIRCYLKWLSKKLLLWMHIFFVLSDVFGQTGDFVLTRRIPSSNQAYMPLRRAIKERFGSYHACCKLEAAFST